MAAERIAELSPRKNILVKVSGDLVDREEFYDWLESITGSLVNITIICGGGTAISDELNKHGILFEFGPAGREIGSLKGVELARQVLERQQIRIQDKLHARGLNHVVGLPVLEIGDMKCHVNGDFLARALYPNFDKVFIATLQDRSKKIPEGYSRMEIVFFRP